MSKSEAATVLELSIRSDEEDIAFQVAASTQTEPQSEQATTAPIQPLNLWESSWCHNSEVCAFVTALFFIVYSLGIVLIPCFAVSSYSDDLCITSSRLAPLTYSNWTQFFGLSWLIGALAASWCSSRRDFERRCGIVLFGLHLIYQIIWIGIALYLLDETITNSCGVYHPLHLFGMVWAFLSACQWPFELIAFCQASW